MKTPAFSAAWMRLSFSVPMSTGLSLTITTAICKVLFFQVGDAFAAAGDAGGENERSRAVASVGVDGDELTPTIELVGRLDIGWRVIRRFEQIPGTARPTVVLVLEDFGGILNFFETGAGEVDLGLVGIGPVAFLGLVHAA